MRFIRTNTFKRRFDRLSPQDKLAVEKALELLAENPRHPSLSLERVSGQRTRWVGRASRFVRFSVDWEGDTITLRVVGSHGDVWRAP